MEKPHHVEKHTILLVGTIVMLLLALGSVGTVVFTGQAVDDVSLDNVSIVIQEAVDSVVVNYETPAPYIVEEEVVEEGRINKDVMVVSESSLHYENVIAYTELPEVDPEQVRIYWLTQDLTESELTDTDLTETTTSSSTSSSTSTSTTTIEEDDPVIVDPGEVEIPETTTTTLEEELSTTTTTIEEDEEEEVEEEESEEDDEEVEEEEAEEEVEEEEQKIVQVPISGFTTKENQNWLKKLFSNLGITGRATEETEAKQELLENPTDEILEELEESHEEVNVEELEPDQKIDVTSEAVFLDTNENGKADAVYWTVPRLSNQTYEIEISLTVISSKTEIETKGIWEISFNTTGIEDLTITPTKGTTFTEKSLDNLETIDDLEFLSLRCGNDTIEHNYVFEDNTTLDSTNSNDQSKIIKSIKYPAYNCPVEGFINSRVLTPGAHTLNIQYGTTTQELTTNSVEYFILNQTKWNTKTIKNTEGMLETEIKIKWVNYLDEDGIWKEINPDFVKTDEGWKVTNAPFKATAPTYSSGTARFESNNRYDIFQEKEIDSPTVTQEITALDVTDVVGVKERGDLGFGEANYIVYEGAYPELNADLIFWVSQGRAPHLDKLVRFNEPIQSDERVRFNIKYSSEDSKDLDFFYDTDKKTWDENTKLLTNESFSVKRENENQDRGVGFKQFTIWDSNRTKVRDINVEIEKIEEGIFTLTKIIPATFFEDANFPVYTDTTSTFLPDPNAETTSVDGEVGISVANASGASYNHMVRDGGSELVQDTSAQHYVMGMYARTTTTDHWQQSWRGFYFFDTSSLPDGDSLTSAYLSLYGRGKWTNNGMKPNASIYSSNSSSTTGLATGDYMLLSMINVSNEIDYDDLSTTNSNNFTLDPGDLDNLIDVTGLTRLASTMPTFDRARVVPPWGTTAGVSGFQVRHADYSGTANDPTLVVVHSSNTAPSLTTQTINSTNFDSNNTLENITVQFLPAEDDSGDTLTCDIEWMKENVTQTDESYSSVSCTNDTLAVFTLTSGNTSKGDNWTAAVRVSDGSLNSDWVNTTAIEILNTGPTTPELNEIINNTPVNSFKELNWSNSTDADGDAITYGFELSSDSSFGSYNYTNYTISETDNVTEIIDAVIPSDGTAKSLQKISNSSGNLNQSMLDGGDWFGQAVGKLTDLNGDGVDDMLVGALWDDDGSSGAGAAYILFMHENGTINETHKISETEGNFGVDLEVNDAFGSAVADAGDLDGDGRSEIAVGAYGDDDGQSSAGAIYILFMHENGTVNRSTKISATNGSGPPIQNDQFGISLAGIGDVNGDGIPDLAVGAPADDDGAAGAGAIYILFMNTTGGANTTATTAKISETNNSGPDLDTNDAFGWSIAALGDVNDDGTPDISVGAKSDDDGASGAGATYVIFLNNTGGANTSAPTQKISNSTGGLDKTTLDGNDQFGFAQGGIGDINGDGIPDLAIGAISDDDGEGAAGAVYILTLNETGGVKTTTKISELTGGGPNLDASDNFGSAVTGMGDLNDDGTEDIAIGAYWDDDGAASAGAVYVLNLNQIDSTYYWRTFATDNTANSSNSDMFEFKLDNTLPNVTFYDETPANNSQLLGGWLYFNWTVTETNLDTMIVSVLNNTDVLNYTEYNVANPLEYNTSIVIGQTYHINISVNDSAGNIGQTELRTIITNTAPTHSLQAINGSIPRLNYSSQDVEVNFLPTDADVGDTLTCDVEWRLFDVVSLTESEVGCTTDEMHVFTLTENNIQSGDVWSAAVRTYDQTAYSDWTNTTDFEVLFGTNFTFSNNATIIEGYNYSDGNFTNTFYNDTIKAIELNDSIESGNFTSQIFDFGFEFSWKNISWVQDLNYGAELPNPGASETVKVGAPADMTDNILLFHLANDSLLGENDTYIYDSSTHENNATVKGLNSTDLGPTVSGRGKFGNALEFDGFDDYLHVTNTSILNSIDQNFTIELWFKPNKTFDNASDNTQGLLDKGAFQIYLDHTDGKLKVTLQEDIEPEWQVSYAGSENEINSMTPYKGVLYTGQGINVPEGDVHMCILEGDDDICQQHEWVISYNGTFNEVASLHVYKGHLYQGTYGGTSGEGDMLVCEPGADGICNTTDWSDAYNGSSYKAGVMTTFNERLYVGEGQNTVDEGNISYCEPGADGICNLSDWNQSFTSGAKAIESLAVFKGHLYAGLGGNTADQGNITVCDPKEDGVCNPGDWNLSFTNGNESFNGLAVFNGRLYATQSGDSNGESDFAYCEPGEDEICDTGDWTLVESTHAWAHLYTPISHNGKLYFGSGNSNPSAKLYVCNPGSNERCDEGDEVVTQPGLTNLNWIFTNFRGRLYSGLGGGTDRGNVSYFGNATYLESSNFTWNDDWQHALITVNGTSASLFINGVEEDTATMSAKLGNHTNTTLVIGTTHGSLHQDSGDHLFNGTIDEIAIFNRSLSSDEAIGHYKRGIDSLLNFTVRSCNDSLCDGESFTDIDDTTPQNLSISSNQFFQYKVEFSRESKRSTDLYNVTIGSESLTIPTVPILNEPLNNTAWPSTPVEFNWSNSTEDEGDSITYGLEISDLIDFSTFNYTNYTITETLNTTSAIDVSLANEGKYYWRVFATDGTANSSNSLTYEFSIDSTSPTIDFDSESPNDNIYYGTEWLYFNWTITEINIDTITVNVINYTGTPVVYNETEYNLLTEEFNTSLADGTYQFNISINDTVGTVVATSLRNVTIDTVAPVIDFDSETEADTTYLASETLYFNWTLTEANIDTITISVHNTTDSYNFTEYRGSLIQEANLTVTDDNYVYNVSINDTVGNNVVTALRNITIDNTAPTIDFDSETPGNNTYLASETLYFNWTLTENNIDTITVVVENSSGAQNHSEYRGFKLLEFNVTLANETYRYNISVNDSAGNLAVTSLRNLTMDNINPFLEYGSATPTNNTGSPTPSLYVNWTLIESNIDTLTVTLANETTILNETTFDQTVASEINFSLSTEGYYVYNITTTDAASNVNFTLTRAYNYTEIPIEVVYSPETPANNTYLDDTNLYFNWTFITTGGNTIDTIWITIVNSTGVINHTEFSGQLLDYNVTLNNENYLFNVSANDSSNNFFTAGHRNVTLDNATPLIEYGAETLANNTFTANPWLYINWTITENNIETVIVVVENGTDIINHTEFTNGVSEFNTSVGLQNNVTFSYNVSVVDKVGRINTTNLRATLIDSAPPTITIASETPSNNSYLNSPTLYINWTFVDKNIDAFTINIYNDTDLVNESVYRGGAPLEHNISLFSGAYVFNVSANDTVGNVGSTGLRNVTLDNVTPLIVFNADTPVNNTVTKDSSLYINWTVTESNQDAIILVLVNDTDIINDTYYRRFIEEANISLDHDALYTYNVSVNDTVGLRNQTEVRTYTLDTTGPLNVGGNNSDVENGGDLVLEIVTSDLTFTNTVTLEVTYPNFSKINLTMENSSGTFWQANLTTPPYGDYDLSYHMSDGLFNNYTHRNITEVFNEINLSGQVRDGNNKTVNATFEFYRPNTTFLLANLTNDRDTGLIDLSNKDLHNRTYDLIIKTFNAQHEVSWKAALLNETVNNLTTIFDEINNTGVQEVIDLHQPIIGLAVNFSLAGSGGNITLNYSGVDRTDESKFALYKCSDWDFNARTCGDTWTNQSDTVQFADEERIQTEVSGFSAYVVVENMCGDGICDDTINEDFDACSLDCPAPFTAPVTTIGGETSSTSGSGGGIVTNIDLAPIQEFLSSLNIINGIQINTNLLDIEIEQGDSITKSILLQNAENFQKRVTITIPDELKDYVHAPETVIDLDSESASEINIEINIPNNADPQVFQSNLILTSGTDSERIPISLKIVEPRKKLILQTAPLKNAITPGEILQIKSQIIRDEKEGIDPVAVTLKFELVNDATNETAQSLTKQYTVTESLDTLEELPTSDEELIGDYTLYSETFYTQNPLIDANSENKIKIRNPFLTREFYGIPAYQYIVGLVILIIVFTGVLFTLTQARKLKRFKIAHWSRLPHRGLFLGKIAQSRKKAYLDSKQLRTHTIISGSSGSGKTIVAQDIVEEALKEGTSVVIFDPTAQWTGFLKKCQDQSMLRLYEKFGMKKKDAKGFKGTIHFITKPTEIIDLDSLMKEGEANIYVINNLNNSEIDQLVASTIQQVFDAKLEETKKLKLLMVYDEVHRLIPKFGGTGKGFVQLERAAREFRKWGIGLMLISQILGDFVEEIHANISTEIQMRTKHRKDLDRIGDKYGTKIFRLLTKARTGTGMIQNSQFNEGKPYFIEFRPILHNTSRLTNAQLKTYAKHSEKVLEVSDSIKQLKELKQDVFDLELELNLARTKLAQSQFRLVNIYLESLEPKVDMVWKKLRKRPKKRKKQYLSTQYLNKNISGAKSKRKQLIITEKRAIERILKLRKEGMKDENILSAFKKSGWPVDFVEQVIDRLPVKKEKKRNKVK